MANEVVVDMKSDGKKISKEASVKKLRLIDFSGDENLAPELIDDALNSTTTFYKSINVADIATKIKNNKAKYGGRIP
jgi:hypothetical protein